MHKSWTPIIYFKNKDKLNKAVNLVPHTCKTMFWVNRRGMGRKVTDYATSPRPDLKEDACHTLHGRSRTQPGAAVPSSLLLPPFSLFLALPQWLQRTPDRPRQLCRPDIALFWGSPISRQFQTGVQKCLQIILLPTTQVSDNKQL